jgi:hypothetical protein
MEKWSIGVLGSGGSDLSYSGRWDFPSGCRSFACRSQADQEGKRVLLGEEAPRPAPSVWPFVVDRQHHSITPSLHHSITPSLHYSITPFSTTRSLLPLRHRLTTARKAGPRLNRRDDLPGCGAKFAPFDSCESCTQFRRLRFGIPANPFC